MTGKLNFTSRMLLMPAVAATAFVVLVVTTQVFNVLTSRNLDRIENGSLVLSADLEAKFREIKRSLQDAVTFDSPESVDDTDLLRDQFLDLIGEAERNTSIDLQRIAEIRRDFEQYYNLARPTTLRTIDVKAIEGTMSEGLLSDVGRMHEDAEALEQNLAEFSDLDRRQTLAAVVETRKRQRMSLLIGLAVSLVSLLMLGWVSRGALASVRILAREVTGSAAKINSSCSQMLAASRQQESAAAQHASAIEETSRTVESLAESARAIAERSQTVLENAKQTLRTNQEIAERNSHLSSRLEGISTILESVKDIANKSELLALNAALEGTKAGEAGRGFSLVAVQMQRLAENVMGNVQDIKHLTREIRQANQTAVLAIEEGTKLAEQTTESAGQIRMVTQQQESATQQVTLSMNDAARQVQQTAVGVRQSTDAVKSLTELAGELQRLLQDLQLSEARPQ